MSYSEQYSNRLELDLISLLRKKFYGGAQNVIRFHIALNLGENVFFAIQDLVDIESSRFR